MRGKTSRRLTALCLSVAMLAVSGMTALSDGGTGSAVDGNISHSAQRKYSIANATKSGSVEQTDLPPSEETEFIFDDTDAEYTGSWTLEEADKMDQRFGSGFRYAEGWVGSNTATYTAQINHAGWYEVSAWWTDLNNRATNAPYTIAWGEQSVQVTANQQEKGGRWNHIQTLWAEAGDTVTVTLGGSGDQFIISDGLKISLMEGIIVDDSEAELTGTWPENVTDNHIERFGTKFRFADPTDQAEPTATATFRAEAPADGVYNVYAWWTTHENRAQNAPFTLSDGTTVRFNQEVNGGRWNLLGKITAKAGDDLSVVIGNNADQYVVADAVKFQLDDGILDEDEAIVEGSTWILETKAKEEERYGDAFYYSSCVSSESQPTATATYRTTAAEDGYYEIYGWWTTLENRSTITPYTLTCGEQSQTVRVNQQENGGQWNLLGALTAQKGETITIVIGNNAEQYIIADAVKVVRVGDPPADTYNITLQYDSQGGMVTGKTAGIAKGESVTLTAEPRGGWELEGWYLDGEKQGEDLQFTLTVDKDVTVEARFQKIVTPDGIIVDDTEAVFTGDWTLETADCLDQRYGEGFMYRVWNGANSQPDSTATFTVTAEEAGYYEIYAWWTTNPNRADDAPYTILCGSGQQTIRVNQRENGGFWNLLGGVMADKGQEISVVLGNNSDNGYVIADAVKFAKVDTPKTYTVTVEYNEAGGSVTGKTSGIVSGETVLLTAAPKSGWSFGGWYQGGIKVCDTTQYSLSVTADVTLEARFTEITEPVGPDKSALLAALKDARMAKTDGRYQGALPSAQQAFDLALEEAERVYDNPDADEKAVTDALADLEAALERLAQRAGDKAELTWVIAYADSLDMAKFQEKGKSEFEQALKAAHAMLDNKEALQLDVDKALQELVHALAALRYAVDR